MSSLVVASIVTSLCGCMTPNLLLGDSSSPQSKLNTSNAQGSIFFGIVLAANRHGKISLQRIDTATVCDTKVETMPRLTCSVTKYSGD